MHGKRQTLTAKIFRTRHCVPAAFAPALVGIGPARRGDDALVGELDARAVSRLVERLEHVGGELAGFLDHRSGELRIVAIIMSCLHGGQKAGTMIEGEEHVVDRGAVSHDLISLFEQKRQAGRAAIATAGWPGGGDTRKLLVDIQFFLQPAALVGGCLTGSVFPRNPAVLNSRRRWKGARQACHELAGDRRPAIVTRKSGFPRWSKCSKTCRSGDSDGVRRTDGNSVAVPSRIARCAVGA